MRPNHDKFYEQLAREVTNAKEVLTKTGYRKTRDGWVVVDRFNQLHEAGLVKIFDKRLFMTYEGKHYDYGRIMQYLTGNRDSL